MAQDTRTRMLETTARLLQHRGYHGTSLSDILGASAAPRGSLYFHFPGGKEALAAEATRAAIAEATGALRQVLAAAPPAEAMRRYAELAADLLEQSGFTFGCPVAPVILDAAGGVPELEGLCREAFETWIGMIAEALAAAGVPDGRAGALAQHAVATIEGLLLIARARRDAAPLRSGGRELEVVLAAALPPGRNGEAGGT